MADDDERDGVLFERGAGGLSEEIMLTINETIETVRNGGAWSAVDDILYHLDQARTLESENKRLTEANTALDIGKDVEK